jgi:hypothetical protein
MADSANATSNTSNSSDPVQFVEERPGNGQHDVGGNFLFFFWGGELLGFLVILVLLNNVIYGFKAPLAHLGEKKKT